MYCLKYSQELPWSIEASWDFFSDPTNLKRLTPDYMEFKILNEIYKKIYPGQIISYTIRPILNIPVNWITEITHLEPLSYFIDEQRFGPYAFWHHEHRFIPREKGVEMQDIIYYKLPFGPIGKMLNWLRVKQDIESIFHFRKQVLLKIFSTTPINQTG